ncbi:hypothetical protein B0H11DRAFT_2300201 [Mycena galericulata]|nr:hypothetical protein B0H11DRAFT_2300201 [Mycena galericulata]
MEYHKLQACHCDLALSSAWIFHTSFFWVCRNAKTDLLIISRINQDGEMLLGLPLPLALVHCHSSTRTQRRAATYFVLPDMTRTDISGFVMMNVAMEGITVQHIRPSITKITQVALVSMDAPTLASLSDLRLVTRVDVAFLTLLAYDTLLSIGQEYRHVWRSKWSLIKCLYLWTRYSTLIGTIFAVQHRFDRAFDPSVCSSIDMFDTIFAGAGIGITEVILMVRTYALYGRSKKLLGFLLIMWLCIGGVSGWAIVEYAESFKVEVGVQLPATNTPCNVDNSTSKLWLVCYVSLMAAETIIVLLTLWKGLHTFFLPGSTYRHSHLVTSFYHDGILFYLATLAIFVVDVVFKIIARPQLQNMADSPWRVLNSIFSCHLVIHVRVIASEEEARMGETKSPILFANLPPGSEREISMV